MPTIGNMALTLSDYRKRMTPDGQLDYIIEYLAQTNRILERFVWTEGNLPTGIQTTLRTGYPKPSKRIINKGIPHTKSATKQITDTTTIFEARSSVDIELLAIQANKEEFRRSEDSAHVEGFGQEIARMIFYGDINSDPTDFNGLAVRYNTMVGADKGNAAYQVIQGGTPNAAALNASMFLVGQGERATTGVYPKNTKAGLTMRDLGEVTVRDEDGMEFQALQTLFNWKVGLTVRNIRSNARVCNIDTTKLSTDAYRKGVIDKSIFAKNRIQNLHTPTTQYTWYVSDSVYTMIEQFLTDKNNVHITRQEIMGAFPQLYLSGIPVEKLDALIETETAIK